MKQRMLHFRWLLPFAIILYLTSCQSPAPKNPGDQTEQPDSPGQGDTAGWADPREVRKENFKGDIKLDVRDSKSDWDAYTPKRAPANSPNVLFILYDDTGLASWSPFGGIINMPTLQRLADRGLIYTQWHTTALWSPTTCTLLTARNPPLRAMQPSPRLLMATLVHMDVSQPSVQPLVRYYRPMAGALSGSARIITCPNRISLPGPVASNGHCKWASTVITVIWGEKPTS